MNKFLSATILSSTFFLMNHSYAYTVDNSSPQNGSLGLISNIYSVGQVFKLTNATYNHLNNFTFYMQRNTGGNISFNAHIYKWDSALQKTIGNAVFSQQSLSATLNSTYTPITIDTTNSPKLNPNQEYIVFITGTSALDNIYLPLNLTAAYKSYYSVGSQNFWSDIGSGNIAHILNFSQWLITAQDTMASMQNNILGLNQIFTMQSDALENSLPQKCSYFNNDNFCVSFTAKFAQANNSSNTDATSGIVNVAYKINPNFYVGGSLEQIVSDVNYSDVNYRQKAPDVSVYTGWNQNDNTEGLNAHIAYRHSNGKVDITRDEINFSEAGSGRSDLTSNAWYASLGNTFNIQNKTLVTPYIAVRYSDIERKAYTENLSDDVATPLSYDDLNRKTTTAIVGVEAVTALTPKVNISGTVGYENDFDKKFSDYSATGVDGLPPLNFNDGYKNNRLFLSTGLDYNFAKNQNIGLNVSYRESAFTPSAVTSASIVYQTSF